MATCATCKHFIGAGDWNLCCDLKYDLCYKHTPACEKYEYQIGGALVEFMREYPERLKNIDFSWWRKNDV